MHGSVRTRNTKQLLILKPAGLHQCWMPFNTLQISDPSTWSHSNRKLSGTIPSGKPITSSASRCCASCGVEPPRDLRRRRKRRDSRSPGLQTYPAILGVLGYTVYVCVVCAIGLKFEGLWLPEIFCSLQSCIMTERSRS